MDKGIGNDMESNPRRAAGTVTFIDNLRSALGHSVAEPEDDVRDFLAGVAINVSAFLDTGSGFRHGQISLIRQQPEKIYWRDYQVLRGYGTATPIEGPFDVESMGPVAGKGSWNIKKDLFRMITMQAGAIHCRIAVPTVDIPLVRTALALAT